MKDISEILQQIRPEYNFSASSDFITDGMLDSFDVVTLVSELERNFCILIQGTDIVPENFQNILTIHALLQKYNVQI